MGISISIDNLEDYIYTLDNYIIPRRMHKGFFSISHRKAKMRYVIYSALIILPITIGVFSISFFSHSQKTSQRVQATKSNTITLAQSSPSDGTQAQSITSSTIANMMASSNVSDDVKNNKETYTNNIVSFHHVMKDSSYTYLTKTDGNRIYVYPSYLSDYKESSFIELFPKNPNDTIQVAIQKAVLTGYNASDCPIGDAYTNNTLPSGVEAATIRYNANNLYKMVPDPIDTSKCPQDYTASEGAKYFAVFPNHPDLLVFFQVSNGLFPADSNSNTMWYQTLSINK